MDSSTYLLSRLAERLSVSVGGLPVPLLQINLDGQFELDPVLPSQRARPTRFGPCEHLMLEVLADAFHTVMARTSLGGHRNARAFRETALWFEQPNSNAPVNLSDCCDALVLDLGCVQAAAQRLICRSCK
jgi:hypothetical protein